MARTESEAETQKRRIDKQLDALGWKYADDDVHPIKGAFRWEELETQDGPADYALCLDGRLERSAKHCQCLRKRGAVDPHLVADSRHLL